MKLTGEVLLAQDLGDAPGGRPVTRGQGRQGGHIQLGHIPGVGDGLTVTPDQQDRLGVRVPMQALADIGDLLLLLREHHIGAGHTRARGVKIRSPPLTSGGSDFNFGTLNFITHLRSST